MAGTSPLPSAAIWCSPAICFKQIFHFYFVIINILFIFAKKNNKDHLLPKSGFF